MTKMHFSCKWFRLFALSVDERIRILEVCNLITVWKGEEAMWFVHGILGWNVWFRWTTKLRLTFIHLTQLTPSLLLLPLTAPPDMLLLFLLVALYICFYSSSVSYCHDHPKPNLATTFTDKPASHFGFHHVCSVRWEEWHKSGHFASASWLISLCFFVHRTAKEKRNCMWFLGEWKDLSNWRKVHIYT